MDEEINSLFYNFSSPEYEINYDRSLIRLIYEYVEIIIIFINILCNAIITYISLRNKRMRSRTTILLANWSIFDLFYAFSQLYVGAYLLYGILEETKFQQFILCLIDYSEIVYACGCVSIMITLVSTKLLDNQNIKMSAILRIIYAIASILFLSKFITCCLQVNYHFLILIYLPALVYLVVVVIIKDINRCRRKAENCPIDNKLNTLNIAKIYAYNWFIAISTEIVINNVFGTEIRDPNIIFNLQGLTKLLTSFYILIYLYFSNKQFKMCVLNLFKGKFRNYDIEPTINYQEGRSEETHDDMQVNININNDIRTD